MSRPARHVGSRSDADSPRRAEPIPGGWSMIGMQFGSFILLLIISVVVSLILHYGLKFYVTPGFGSFLGKVVVGWIGGWLGSPVLGHWGPSVNTDQVFVIPAILGCLALLALAVDALKSWYGVG